MSVAIAAIATIGTAAAQTYPSRPITIIAPFPAGGPLDTIARIISEPMRVALGQPMVIENVAGAGGNIGTGRVARAAPDGYTLGIGQWSTHVVNAVTYNLPYRRAERFRADRAAHDHAAIDHRPQGFSGQRREGADRLAQGQSRPGDRRHRRRRRRSAGLRHLLPAGHRHALPVRALSRRRPGDAGPGRGPGRPHARPGRERARSGSRRRDQGLCGDGQDALVGAARRSGDRRVRRARALRRLLARHVGAQGHAQGRSSPSSMPRW